MRRLLIAVAAAASVLAAGAEPAAATNECRGLLVCVRVAGPWVVVPARRGSTRPRAQFQLSCPRGFVVAGTDAELTSRALDVSFGAKLGSPVGPGVTTGRSLLFSATYTGGGNAPTSFRPHLGCIPGSGGGGGPVPYSVAPTFPPGEPTTRRVRTFPLTSGGAIRVRQGCGRGEYFVSGWHAFGIYGSRPPSEELMRGVPSAQSVRGGRLTVVARVLPAVLGVRAVLQVGAVCGGGR